MKGLNNIGATCWLNALVQCLRVCKDWNKPTGLDKVVTLDKPVGLDFYKVMRGESDNTTDILKNDLLPQYFTNSPNDSQEAFLYLVDRLKLKEFEGEVTQTVIYPGGRSVSKSPCTIWFHQEKHDVIEGYKDENGHVYNVAVIRRTLTKVPEILVSDTVQEELFGKKLLGIVLWVPFGHYVAYVKEAGDWWLVDDLNIKREEPILTRRGYIAFYGVGKTYTPRTHFEET